MTNAVKQLNFPREISFALAHDIHPHNIFRGSGVEYRGSDRVSRAADRSTVRCRQPVALAV